MPKKTYAIRTSGNNASASGSVMTFEEIGKALDPPATAQATQQIYLRAMAKLRRKRSVQALRKEFISEVTP